MSKTEPPINTFEDEDKLEKKDAKDWATGLPAVTNSLAQVYSAAGAVRGTKALLKLNQKRGFDCPSCAWPDPDEHRSPAEFCENGAKAVASEATRKTADRDFFARYSVPDLLEKSDAWHERQGRLTEPMVLKPSATHYEPISWDDAFALIADEMKALPSADDAIFYTSGRCSNEAAFLYQLMVRHYGTNNLPDCSNMCHESSGAALKASIGVGKGTVSLDDIYAADTIICVGQNPGTNHPRMLSALEKAVKNGAELVAVNPLKEAGLQAFANPQNPAGLLNRTTKLTSQYLQIAPNGDHALFRALAKIYVEREDAGESIFDHEFIAEHTLGITDYIAAVKRSDWADLLRDCQLPKEEIEALADTILGGERRLITCWAMGLTQHVNAVATIREITNLHLLLGAIGRKGAGLCPVRGHSNVQGDRTMGIFEKMPPAFHDKLDAVFDFKSPREHGYDTVMAIKAMHDQPGKVFFAMGGNFAQASPDSAYTFAALRNCKLTAHVATKLNRSHLVTGDTALILPCLGRSDLDLAPDGKTPRFISCENSMGVVQASQGSLDPVSDHLRSEPEIVAGLATKLVGNTSTVDWDWLAEDYDRIRDLVEKVVPGFDFYTSRVRDDGGFYLPNSAKERQWTTDTGKANFAADAVTTHRVGAGRLLMQTLRSHDQYNTTVYGMDDRYRGIGHARRIIFLNPKDMETRGIRPLQQVDITSHYSDKERVAAKFQAIPYDIPAGSAATYFPEANVLVPIDSTAIESNTPSSKAVEITIQPSQSQ